MERMTAAQYRNMAKRKPSKYRAEPTVLEGIRFDSKAEADYYAHLLMLKRAGEITQLTLQPKFILQEHPKITYIADFDVTWATGERVVYDVKGMLNQTFKLKLKLFKAKYPEVMLQLIKRKRKGWETV